MSKSMMSGLGDSGGGVHYSHGELLGKESNSTQNGKIITNWQ